MSSAKIGVGSFYAHFDGKEDCFLGAYDRILLLAGERMNDATGDTECWAEKTYLGLREILEIFLAEPLAARIVLIEVQTAGPAATARYNELMDSAVGRLRRSRALYAPAAELPETYELAAIAGLAFFLQQRLLSSRQESTESLLAEAGQMLLEPILGRSGYSRLRSARPASAIS